MNLLSSTYRLYASGKISLRALGLNQNPNFQGSLKVKDVSSVIYEPGLMNLLCMSVGIKFLFGK